MTTEHVYKIIYIVIKDSKLHLGEDKASAIANTFAVKATWHVFNSPSEYLRYAHIFSQIITKDSK